MEKRTIKGAAGDSLVITGEKIENLNKYLPENNVFIITDKNIYSTYKKKFPKFPVFAVPPGEKSKSTTTTAKICSWLLENNADRSSFILGIGGGVVCDIAGFVASTFMRGVKFGFVATSLLAQVDASVGGKNGINLKGYKNIIGTFNQPKFVICDTSLLKTLPKEEYYNGFAEIIKHALISDYNKFCLIEKNVDDLRKGDTDLLGNLVKKSVNIKSDIVEADEFEGGIRKKLNLGHTWGHAVEKVAKIPHGKAVSIGLVFAGRLSVKKGLLKEEELERIITILQKLELPVIANFDPKLILKTIIKDKKKQGDHIDFILMNGIGDVVIEKILVSDIKKMV